jgi:hypothetical protein
MRCKYIWLKLPNADVARPDGVLVCQRYLKQAEVEGIRRRWAEHVERWNMPWWKQLLAWIGIGKKNAR